jgi:hypothetical protein
MNICVFDTETTSLNRPFCYNVGYVIVRADDWTTLESRSFVVEQIWHNMPLFSTAYYANKRPIYVAEMRARKTIMEKFGYICQQMARDFKAYEIKMAFAYNSNFDEKVFEYNCDWFKCINPFDDIVIKDIRGFVHKFLITKGFKEFCDEHQYYTDSGNYSTTAETLYRYITLNEEFEEAHTALKDAEIESDILCNCVEYGANLEDDYQAQRSIPRESDEIKTLTVFVDDEPHDFTYQKMRMTKDKSKIFLK